MAPDWWTSGPAVAQGEPARRRVDPVAYGVGGSLEWVVVLTAVGFDDQERLRPDEVARETEHSGIDVRSWQIVSVDDPAQEGDLQRRPGGFDAAQQLTQDAVRPAVQRELKQLGVEVPAVLQLAQRPLDRLVVGAQMAREVNHGPRRRRDRDPLPFGDLERFENGPVEEDAGSFAVASGRDGHIDPRADTVADPKGRGRAPVAEHGSRTAGQDSSVPFGLTARREVSQCVHTLVDPEQPPGLHRSLDALGRHSAVPELLGGDPAVLSGRELRGVDE